jgi:hypothetical protein
MLYLNEHKYQPVFLNEVKNPLLILNSEFCILDYLFYDIPADVKNPFFLVVSTRAVILNEVNNPLLILNSEFWILDYLFYDIPAEVKNPLFLVVCAKAVILNEVKNP